VPRLAANTIKEAAISAAHQRITDALSLSQGVIVGHPAFAFLVFEQSDS
jgi:hypothetical protein